MARTGMVSAWVAWLVLALAGAAHGAVEIRPAFDDVLREGSWESLRVTVRVPPGAGAVTLTLQDARGGPRVSRTIGGSEERTLLMPLPLVAASGLKAGEWPVRYTLAGPGISEDGVAAVPRREGAARAHRVATTGREEPVGMWQAGGAGGGGGGGAGGGGGGGAAVFLRLSMEELLNDPPLALAGCDTIFLDEASAGKLNARRAADLAACGIQLASAGATSPAGELAGWLWVRPAGSGRLWVTPPEHAAWPRVPALEAGLGELPLPALRVPRDFRLLAILMTPAAMVVVLLVRVFTGRPWWALAASAVLLAGFAAATVGMLGLLREEAQANYSWTVRRTGGTLGQADTVTVRRAMFRERVALSSLDPVPPLPVAPTGEEYLRQAPAEVALPAAGDAPARVTLELGARRTAVFVARGAVRAKGPETPGASGWVIAGGYAAPVGEPARRVIFTRWVEEQPAAVRESLRAWYALQARGDHRYWWAGGEGGLEVADLGTEPAPQEAPPEGAATRGAPG